MGVGAALDLDREMGNWAKFDSRYLYARGDTGWSETKDANFCRGRLYVQRIDVWGRMMLPSSRRTDPNDETTAVDE
jgi:hypothetical protein